MGGTLRDLYLQRATTDLDLACQGHGRALAARLAEKLKGTLVVLDDATRVYRIVLTGKDRSPGSIRQIDIAEIQGNSIEEDLMRRDFTCNAMALPVSPSGTLLDPRHGLQDIRRRVLRADLPHVFEQDPLRLLRAFRLAAQLGLSMDAATLRHIRAHRSRVLAPAGERIRQELMALLSVHPCHPWVRLMDQSGILTALFKDLEVSRRCAEVYYGKGGVLKHALDAVERMDLLSGRIDTAIPGLAHDIRGHYEAQGGWANRIALLQLAVLLHDIAKPATAKRIAGRLRFFGHDLLGARMAESILKRLRFSRQEIATVSLCIRHHLRPGNLAANQVVSDKAVYRFFRELGPDGVSVALVCWADHASYLSCAKLEKILAHAGQDPHTFRASSIRDEETRKTLRHLQVIRYLLHNFFRHKERVAPPRILDGNDVMKILKIAPGPSVGKVLAKLQEAQAAGTVQNREAALRFIRRARL